MRRKFRAVSRVMMNIVINSKTTVLIKTQTALRHLIRQRINLQNNPLFLLTKQ